MSTPPLKFAIDCLDGSLESVFFFLRLYNHGVQKNMKILEKSDVYGTIERLRVTTPIQMCIRYGKNRMSSNRCVSDMGRTGCI
jgi:hypothetical protein